MDYLNKEVVVSICVLKDTDKTLCTVLILKTRWMTLKKAL